MKLFYWILKRNRIVIYFNCNISVYEKVLEKERKIEEEKL